MELPIDWLQVRAGGQVEAMLIDFTYLWYNISTIALVS